MADQRSRLAAIVRDHESHILAQWTESLAKAGRGSLDRAEVEEQARSFVRLLVEALGGGASGDVDRPVGGSASGDFHRPAWPKVRELLASLSPVRARQGRAPAETATFIFSFKEP